MMSKRFAWGWTIAAGVLVAALASATAAEGAYDVGPQHALSGDAAMLLLAPSSYPARTSTGSRPAAQRAHAV